MGICPFTGNPSSNQSVAMTPGKTYVVCHEGLTVVWFNGNVISAWDNEGNSINLWFAHVVTKPLANRES